jgi:kynurenine formamidase
MRPRQLAIACAALLLSFVLVAERPASRTAPAPPLWRLYDETLSRARYVDLTHAVSPHIPVWAGFGKSTFAPAIDPKSGKPFTYAKDGFEATHYDLATDQLGTQLDPPAHWDPDYPAIDELPPTFAVRPLVVLSIVEQVKRDLAYHLAVADVLAWEARHGRIPAGAVVFVRSDWSKEWPSPELATRTRFPGVSLAALKFLHLERHILFHGHEPLDTDTTPNLEGESWLMHHGYTEAGALVAIGYPKLQGGTGGYARFIAICPPDWPHGVRIGEVPDAPLARQAKRLHWDPRLGMRVR